MFEILAKWPSITHNGPFNIKYSSIYNLLILPQDRSAPTQAHTFHKSIYIYMEIAPTQEHTLFTREYIYMEIAPIQEHTLFIRVYIYGNSSYTRAHTFHKSIYIWK